MIDCRYYGQFGGAFLPEVLVSTFEQLVTAFEEAKSDPAFWQKFIPKKGEEYRA